MSASISKELTQAKRFLGEGKFDVALQIVQNIENMPGLSPHDQLTLYILKSTLLNKLGQYEESVKVAEQAFQESQALNEPLYQVDSLIGKVQTLWALGRLDEGLQVIEQAEETICLVNNYDSELFSRMASLFFHKGVIYGMKGREDQALQYFQQSLAFSKKLGDQKELATCLNAISIIYRRKGELDRAMMYQQRSLDLKEQLGDKLGISLSLNNLGSIYWYKGELDQALECYQQNLALSEELGNKKVMAATLGNMGLIYQDQGDLNQALEYQERSLALSQEVGNPQDIAIDLDNLGRIYDLQGDLQQALEYYQQALPLKEQIGNKESIAITLISLGRISRQQGELDQALEYYQQSLVLFEEVDDQQHMAESFESIGRVYAEQGDFEQALKHLEKSLTIYEEVGNKLRIASVLLSLILVCIERMPERTQEYFQHLQDIKDQENNKLVNQRYHVAEALLLKSRTRSRDKIKATELLEQIVAEEIVDHELTIIALLNLCDLLLKELRLSGSPAVLLDVQTYINRLFDIAKYQQSHSLLVETYLLKGMVVLVEKLDVPEACRLVTQARLTAEEKGLNQLIKIIEEQEALLGQLSQWRELIEQNASLADRVELVRLAESVSRMIRKQGMQSVEASTGAPMEALTQDKIEDTVAAASMDKYSLCFSLFDERKGPLLVYHSPRLSPKEAERIVFRSMVSLGLFQSLNAVSEVERKRESILPLEDVNRAVFFYLFELTPKNPQKFRGGKILGAFAILTLLNNQPLLHRDASRLSQALDALFESVRSLIQDCCSDPDFTNLDFTPLSAVLTNYSLKLQKAKKHSEMII